MAEPRTNVYIWATWLSKLMAGEVTCDFQVWFKAHHTYNKLASGFDVAKWTMDHTRALRQLRAERIQSGERTFIENENSFRYEVRPGVWLAGKPDLVTVPPAGPTVYDVKTGQPKTSDQIQVMIYMHVLPLAITGYRGAKPSGCVAYENDRKSIPASAVDDAFVKNFEFFINVIAATAVSDKAPSTSECRFCDIGKADCPDRVETAIMS